MRPFDRDTLSSARHLRSCRAVGLAVGVSVGLGACFQDDYDHATAGPGTSSISVTGLSGDASTGGATTSTATSTATSAATSAATTGSEMKFDLGSFPDSGGPDQTGCKNVDLLFVIDNSISMSDEQSNLISSFPGFVSAMQTQLKSTMGYHVGVVTTDANAYNAAGCNEHGALVTKTGGASSSNKTCGPYASGKRYMDESDDLAEKFGCAALVGIGGDLDEQPMHALERAIGGELGAPGACNEGFIRPDALLVVVVITDEEDDHEAFGTCMLNPNPGSPGEPADWYKAVVAAKGGIESNIVVLALVGPPAPTACPELNKCNGLTGAEVGARLVEFTKMFTYGTVGQVCAPSYEAFFAEAIGVIDTACQTFDPVG